MNPCIVNQHVNVTESFECSFDKPCHLITRSDIGGDEFCSCSLADSYPFGWHATHLIY
jgi:hypothetical protein